MRRWYGRSKTADLVCGSEGDASSEAPPVYYASLTDPNATPEQRAALAQSAVDHADWASRRLEEFVPSSSRRVEAQRELESIIEEMKPIAEGMSRDPFRLVEVPEWTGGPGYANIASHDWLEPQGSFKLPDEIIGHSVGAKSHNYDILDLETGEHYHLAEGSSLQSVEVFAGKGTRSEFRKADWYADRYGGDVDAWQHAKGIGTVDTPDGQYKAELHWTQREGFGKIDIFIKRWLE